GRRLVDQRAVAAAEVAEPERGVVTRIPLDPGVLAAHQVVPFGVELDRGRLVATDGERGDALERELLDLMGLRAAEMANDDSPHGVPLPRGGPWAARRGRCLGYSRR